MSERKRCANCEHGEVFEDNYPCNKCKGWKGEGRPYWMAKIPEPTPKGIDIIMTCGETHHIDTEQPEIATVEINGEQVYPTTKTFHESDNPIKTLEAFADMMTRLSGKQWSYEGFGRMEDCANMTKDNRRGRSSTEHVVIPWCPQFDNGYSRFGVK